MAKQRQSSTQGRGAAKAQPIAPPSKAIRTRFAFLEDFFSINWQRIPQRWGYGIYALGLYANYPDFIELATDALTEGPQDRDVDFCLVDRDRGRIFIGQTYLADEWGKSEAPANKADNLLTALSWLLRQPLESVPPRIRDKAREVQEALSANEIEGVHLLFVHNAMESANVADSLAAVADSAKTLIQQQAVSTTAFELGLEKIQQFYDSFSKQIVVDEKIVFPIEEFTRESGEGWEAISTTISGEKLHELYRKHDNKLFSANIRGFLDMLGHNRSINKGILDTIQQEPEWFWAYNNGITILTKKITPRAGEVEILGASVINGAQTTGVIGRAPPESAKKVRVPCRFICCSDRSRVDAIIEFNNTQNEIRSFDFRSRDDLQLRLHAQFERYGITYHHRREGATRLPPGTIQAEVLAPYLASFHDQFQTATRQRRAIFEERTVYGSVFKNEVNVGHVYLVQCLADAISRIKQSLLQNGRNDSGLNEAERGMANLLRHSTSKYFVVGIVGRLAGMIAGQNLSNRFRWGVSESWIKPDRDAVVERWKLVVDLLLPLIAAEAGEDAYETVRSANRLDEIGRKLVYSLQALRRGVDESFSALRDVTEVY